VTALWTPAIAVGNHTRIDVVVILKFYATWGNKFLTSSQSNCGPYQ
jgi:hypothetical protein